MQNGNTDEIISDMAYMVAGMCTEPELERLVHARNACSLIAHAKRFGEVNEKRLSFNAGVLASFVELIEGAADFPRLHRAFILETRERIKWNRGETF
jgi:hypothetical protein